MKIFFNERDFRKVVQYAEQSSDRGHVEFHFDCEKWKKEQNYFVNYLLYLKKNMESMLGEPIYITFKEQIGEYDYETECVIPNREYIEVAFNLDFILNKIEKDAMIENQLIIVYSKNNNIYIDKDLTLDFSTSQICYIRESGLRHFVKSETRDFNDLSQKIEELKAFDFENPFYKNTSEEYLIKKLSLNDVSEKCKYDVDINLWKEYTGHTSSHLKLSEKYSQAIAECCKHTKYESDTSLNDEDMPF